MSNKLFVIFFRAWSFAHYFFRAKTKYNVHSPLVYEFILNVLEEDKWYYSFSELKALRKELLQVEKRIDVEDFGVGSQVIHARSRKIKDIARTSLSAPYFCQVLFSLVHWLKPEKVLELGTSLGVSTLYMSKANAHSAIVSIEGCSSIAENARNIFKLYQANNIKVVTGNFDDVLQTALDELQIVQLFVIDGNHQKEATLRYFEFCLKNADLSAVFVFDDIYWSKEMSEAWQTIKLHTKTKLTIDIFQYGIVFLQNDFKEKQHFTLIDSKYKFWNTGLWG
ncbi:MAG: O-methyltransferase [Saprospiraceae bacterium]